MKKLLRMGFLWIEGWLDKAFGPTWNPLHNLGTLGFFYYWIVAVSGFYVYIFFDTGVTEAYESVEYMTNDQWYLAGVMRSLHRYASDGMMLMMLVHIVREFAFDRYRGPRWFTWFTGVPILMMVFASGVTGYWLVWDELAQYIAIGTTEWLDWLDIFGEPVARNFLSPGTLDDRFFTLMVFMHIFVPLFLLIVLWIHLQRVSRPRVNPPRGLAIGTFLMMMAISIVQPAVSHAPADLAKVPAELDLDWFYLVILPVVDTWSAGTAWAITGIITLVLFALPWLPPMRRATVAAVDLNNCNGCVRCADDCPFNAISMGPRTDGKPFDAQAVVNTKLCVSCGICVGACPTATPFRRASELVAGIELPDQSLKDIREDLTQRTAGLSGDTRIVVFGCEHGVPVKSVADDDTVTVVLPCISMLPPSFIDFVISRDLADGVVISGCGEGECYHRMGIDWTEARMAGTRDPHLRKRVPRDRIATCWASALDPKDLKDVVSDLRRSIATEAQQPPPEASSGANLEAVGND